MKIKEFIKNNRNFLLNTLNITRQTLYYYSIGRCIPKNKELYKKMYLLSKGKIQPNDFFPIDDWKQELKQSKNKK